MQYVHSAVGYCFPASAVVTVLEGGTPIRANISQVEVGDMVMVRLISVHITMSLIAAKPYAAGSEPEHQLSLPAPWTMSVILLGAIDSCTWPHHALDHPACRAATSPWYFTAVERLMAILR